MAYYAVDNPCPTYDYNYAGNALLYSGYVEDELALEGLIEEANTRGGYYDDDYIYAS